MAASWDKEKTEQLISLLEERPCLYNTKLKVYFNRDLRKKAHEEIAEAVGLSGKTVLCEFCMYCCSIKNVRFVFLYSGGDSEENQISLNTVY